MTGVNDSTRVPALDGIRGIAIALVVASHVLPDQYGIAGGAGVAAFFTLSGFLIATLLLAERDAGGISIPAFYLRRARRLLPALVAFVILLVAAGLVTIRDAVPPLIYLENVIRIPALHASANGFHEPISGSLLGHTWSLSVEEQFYLLFPLALVALSRRLGDRALLIIFGTVAAASMTWRLIIGLRPGNLEWYAYYATETNAGLLLVGVCLALAIRTTTWRPPAVTAGPAVVMLAALGYVLGSQDGWVIVPVLASLTTVVLIAAAIGSPSRLLTSRALMLLGRRSYGLYLWHFPVLMGWKSVGSPLWALLPFLALIWGLTLLSWHYVEAPFLTGRFSSRPQRSRDIALTAT